MTESERPVNKRSHATSAKSPDLAMAEELRENWERLRSSISGLADRYLAAAEAFRPVAIQLSENINGLLINYEPFLKKAMEAAVRLPPAYKEALRVLGMHGWYMDLEMPLLAPLEIRDALEKGQIEEAEEALSKYFESHLDQIEQSLAKAHPKRAIVLASAFSAHRASQFDLSIPVFLAQTDGICSDIAKRSLFMRRDGKPLTSSFVESMAGDVVMNALLTPLGEPLPINASHSERRENWTALNRHMVLHGESVDYGTKINSLKAISLINYVSAVLTMSQSSVS